MIDTTGTASVFTFNFAGVTDTENTYIAGVANDLENRDVHHTILWERVAGSWKRLQWKNRSYGVATYSIPGDQFAVYMGFDGTLKVRGVVAGSSEEKVDSGDDGPSSLRPVSSIRVIGDYLYVVGMRRMVYRRSLTGLWDRVDDGIRQERTAVDIAGLNSIDGTSPDRLYAVGLAGEIWCFEHGNWRTAGSPTNIRLSAVRCLPDGRVVVGGAQGTLLVGDSTQWLQVDHEFASETFSCIEYWNGRCFVSTDSGALFELHLGDVPALAPFDVEELRSVNWLTANAGRVYFIGAESVKSLGVEGWRDDSPPTTLLA